MAEQFKPAQLKDSVAKKFTLTVPNKEFIFKMKKIDIEQIDIEEAEQLVNNGFPFLKPIEKATSSSEKK
jgi:hypothetical protein